jgi:tetratricopeptide (TPR) repeat protein
MNQEGGHFTELRLDTAVVRSAACPPDETWLSLVAHLIPERDAAVHLQHAVECDYCGRLLREATEDLSDQLSPKESALIAALPSSSEEGRKCTAAGAAEASRSPKEIPARPRPRRLLWVVWPAAAVVAIGTLSLINWIQRNPTPERSAQLLTRAYTEQRMSSMYWPGAEWSRLLQPRADARPERPTPLVQAEEILSRPLPFGADAADWLAVRSMAEIQERNYEAAVELGQQAVAKNPQSARALQALAMAFFARGEAQNRIEDYRIAAEWFNRALSTRPVEAAVLFDRALCLQRLQQHQEALQAWQEFLQVSPGDGWANEARDHMAVSQRALDVTPPGR